MQAMPAGVMQSSGVGTCDSDHSEVQWHCLVEFYVIVSTSCFYVGLAFLHGSWSPSGMRMWSQSAHQSLRTRSLASATLDCADDGDAEVPGPMQVFCGRRIPTFVACSGRGGHFRDWHIL